MSYPSPRGTFNIENFKRWGIGSLIAGGAAAITYGISHIVDLQLSDTVAGIVTVALTAVGTYIQHLIDGPTEN